MFEKLKHIKSQYLIKHCFHDVTPQSSLLKPSLESLGGGSLPVYAPYVKEDDVFYIVDKFQIIPIKLLFSSILLIHGNAIISVATKSETKEFNQRTAYIRIVSSSNGSGVTILFKERGNSYGYDMEFPLYRTDKDALNHKIYKDVINVFKMPFLPTISSVTYERRPREENDVLYLHYWRVGSDNILGTVPKQEKYVTSTLFFKENGITVGNRFLDAIPGDPVYRTKEEVENVIYRSLLESYYMNNIPKDDTETI